MFGKIAIAAGGFAGGVVACLYAETKFVKLIATPELKQEAREFGWLFIDKLGYRLVKAAEKPGRSPVPMKRSFKAPGYINYSPRGFAERNTMCPVLSKKDLTFESNDVAEEVLVVLRDVLNKYGSVTINDLADIIGSKMTRTFLNDKFGWTDLSEAVILNETLILPDPIRLRD